MGKNNSQALAHESRKIQIRDLRESQLLPVREVAKIVGLPTTSVYPYLKEIADEKGVPYESLLDYPHYGYHREAPYVKKDASVPRKESISDPLEALIAELQDMKADCENMLVILRNIDDAMKGE